MRLGVRHKDFCPQSILDLEALCPLLDSHGLSCIQAPEKFWEWSDEECWNFGQKANELDIVIGETGYWENFLDPDIEKIKNRINTVRSIMYKADIMGVKCVATLVGSRDVKGGALSPHPYNFSNEAKIYYREVCLRIIDGLDLKICRHVTEPWCNTFFYGPNEISDFLNSIHDKRSGLHLDQMNMVSPSNYFHTTDLINCTFDLLAEHIASVHAKDILWDPKYKFIKMDEVYVGEGVLDYSTFLNRLRSLEPNMTIYIEHFYSREEVEIAIKSLLRIASASNVKFLPRCYAQFD